MKRVVLSVLFLLPAYIYSMHKDPDCIALSEQLCVEPFILYGYYDDYNELSKSEIINIICRSATITDFPLYEALRKPETFRELTDRRKKELFQTMLHDEMLDDKTRLVVLLEYVALLDFQADRLRLGNILSSVVKESAHILRETQNIYEIDSRRLIVLLNCYRKFGCNKELDIFCSHRRKFYEQNPEFLLLKDENYKNNMLMEFLRHRFLMFKCQ